MRAWSPGSEPVLEVTGCPLPLNQVRSAYLRPSCLDSCNGEDRGYLEMLSAWADLSPARVVNRPTPSALNNSKPLQNQYIKRCGLRVPETIVTTDPFAARRFAMETGEVIYKSTSGIRSIVKRLSKERMQDLDAVTNCPTPFQRYIPGYDIRVHIIGTFVHALLIESDCDDYRYASQ
jgi:hypothetical protein